MNKIKDLPKYKKQWIKERHNFGYSENLKEVYLVFEQYNPILHHGEWKTTRLLQWPKDFYPCEDTYFFEIFKYLIKYQKWIEEDGGRFEASRIEMKTKIKQHLIRKHLKQLTVKTKLSILSDHSKFINYCFDKLDIRSKITLVIQKKIGYKYYENITYY